MSEDAYAHLYGNLTSNIDIRGFHSKIHTLQQDEGSSFENYVSHSSVFPRLLSERSAQPAKGVLETRNRWNIPLPFLE